ncbi:MAG: nucleotidyl transferase AbiEii/AbiGii toxin family protein [Thermoanaerobaculia bacterium]|nr:nucleotidyl transferase AbiEii/AbiGii toxin family protein [Thermoanaerobaculia bacterium]
MNPLEFALRTIARDLDRAGKQWAVVGGLAVGARAEPRTTRDVDLAVAVADDRSAERLVRDLQARGYSVVAVLEQQATGRLATVRLRPPGGQEGGVVVDLLFASSGVESEVADAAESLEIVPGLVVPVAKIGHLIALKLLARDDRSRPQDSDDLRALVREATEEDLLEARAALTLIEGRGFQRGRALLDLLDDLVRT